MQFPNPLSKPRRGQPVDGVITVVTGLPRSGTSMMMAMLEAGGMPLLTDGARPADTHNPRGYFELQKARSLRRDRTWLDCAQGRAVKIISFHLYELPETSCFNILFMDRDLREVVASQRQMLAASPPAQLPSTESEITLLARHLDHVRRWLAERPNVRVLFVPYVNVLDNPLACATQIADFLSLPLDCDAMASTVAPELHRQRLSRLD